MDLKDPAQKVKKKEGKTIMNRIYCARFKRGAVYAPFSRQSLARAAGSTQLERKKKYPLFCYFTSPESRTF